MQVSASCSPTSTSCAICLQPVRRARRSAIPDCCRQPFHLSCLCRWVLLKTECASTSSVADRIRNAQSDTSISVDTSFICRCPLCHTWFSAKQLVQWLTVVSHTQVSNATDHVTPERLHAVCLTLQRLLTLRELPQFIMDDFVSCREPSCQAGGFRPSLCCRPAQSACPHCNTRMSTAPNRDAATVAWIDQNTIACPGCNVRTVHDGGCIHMTCSRCSTEFCWQCGQLWSLPGHGNYSHCGRLHALQQERRRRIQMTGLVFGLVFIGYLLTTWLQRYVLYVFCVLVLEVALIGISSFIQDSLISLTPRGNIRRSMQDFAKVPYTMLTTLALTVLFHQMQSVFVFDLITTLSVSHSLFFAAGFFVYVCDIANVDI